MIDRVNNLIQGQNQLQSDRRNNAAESNRTSQDSSQESANTRPEADRVSLSDSGRQMQSLEQRVSESTGVDQERVAALRDAIERGNYEVDANQIADAMIRDSREL